ncbi:Pimeloyl-ACP methyl ester carboxylesterase [Nocardioides terrae]|uniref:Pimeloyl-ACP methyl ester carboxylesterase n=1 Tax=Nocardioides terrae TaxID=574651 RepID=A0A1I1NGJ2_9ACTN|nr:alpha/beta fold hydrolase [Nocardioides terrae]SFC96741.1 Pimeloyl-ACP methyl ester carboxylesterase [Nocardioides terrae]
MAASLATGVLAALLLVFAPFVAVTLTAITGAVLCGLAIGWAMLLGLSYRFTDQPQRWAAAPALFMGVGGLLLWAFGGSQDVLRWIWPPALLALVVWMAVRVQRDLLSRAGRVQLYAVFIILALCAVGGAWQTVAAAGESNPFLTSGQLVTVDGHQLRLECTGTASPTVILEGGAGATSADMGWIAPAVASQTRTCVYDRAGRGGSQPAATAQDGAQIATDLHTLLHKANVPGPYVLAGHSFGGLYVRIFAAHYPDEVAGLALLDSTASSQPAKSVIPAPDSTSSDTIGRAATLASLTVPVGIARLYGAVIGDSGLPPHNEEQLTYDTTQANTVRSVADEYMRGGAASQEAASLRDFGDKPLYVLTAGSGNDQSWKADQNRSTSLSTNSVWRVVNGASHQGLLQEKQYAAQTSRAVLDVVIAVRNHQPLTASR